MSRVRERLRLDVREVRHENDETRTFVFEPFDSQQGDAYQAGQFLTLHIPSSDDGCVSRSYSLSSCPVSDPYPAITVKREPEGEGSSWLFANAHPGAVLEASPACGSFQLDASQRPMLMFAAGVGITPIYSLCKFALRTTDRQIHLHYTTRSEHTAVFVDELTQLADRYPGRFTVSRHLSDMQGRLEPSNVEALVRATPDPMVFVCGPGPYIDMVCDAGRTSGMSDSDLVIEAFTPTAATSANETTVHMPHSVAVVTIDGQEQAIQWPPQKSLVEAIEDHGLRPPSSCRQGECLTCECRIEAGEAHMRTNSVLDDDEVAEGYALACQLTPVSEVVRISF